MVQAQIAQTQNNIQSQVAQTQNTIGDQFRNIQDNLNNRVSDIGRNVAEYSGPGSKRKIIVGDDGVTEEMTTTYISPDGNSIGYAKTSRTSFTNLNRP